LNKEYNKSNFHKHTFCIWQEADIEVIKDLTIHYVSVSGSHYSFTNDGVYRISNHWGRAANCRWRLQSKDGYKNQHSKIGFAYWTDFYPNDDISKLFFIKINFDTKEVSFHHKDSEATLNKVIYRNANDTAKRINFIKEVLLQTNWAKHLQYETLEILRVDIIKELIDSNKSFLTIKQKYHRN
jgi:hypothetical protein